MDPRDPENVAAGASAGGASVCGRCGSTVRLGETCAACVLELALGEGGGSDDAAGGADEEREAGWRFGAYEILGEIAHGGMGVVYRARQTRLGRIVALKMIRSGQLARPEEIQRFRTEATAAARLRHPGIVAIHEIGEESGQPYFSMDLIEGPNLAVLGGGKPMETRRAVGLVSGVAMAVQFAHEHGVLHRDLKPSNVLVGVGDVPHVTDFGLARLEAVGDDGMGNGVGVGEVTATGAVLGSPSYMPPEQALGRVSEVTVRSDVYALGAILYELLTGRPPFGGGSPAEVLRRVIEREPVAPRVVVPTIPRDLETVCLRCLSKRPQDRYGTARELAEELGRVLRGEPVLARRVSVVERWVRWCRREPVLSGALSTAVVLLGVTAVVLAVSAARIDRARRQAEGEAKRAAKAEGEAREQLRAALLAQARAIRFTGRRGQRQEALAAAASAGAVRTGVEVRDEAVAALALPDIGIGKGFVPEGSVDRLAFDPDGGRVVIDVPGVGMVVRRLRDGTELVRLETGGQAVRGFPVFGPGDGMLVARLADDRVRAWRLPSGEPAWALEGRPYPDRPRTTRFGEDLVVDPGGRWVAVGHPAGGMTFHDRGDGRELRRWDSEWVPRRAAVSADGRWVAVGDFTDEEATGVVVIDGGTGVEAGRLDRLGGVRGLAWAADGSSLAVALAGRVEIYRWPGGGLHRRLETPDGPAMDLAFDPSGEWLLSHSSRAVFRWWRVREGRVALEFTQPVALAARVAVSRDFRSVAVAGTSESQRPLVGILGFEPSPAYRVVPPPEGGASAAVASSIGTLDFSPDGSWISVACLDEVQVRDRGSGRLVARLVRPGRSDWSTARFGADRTVLYVSSREKGLFRYRLREDGVGGWVSDGGELVDGEDDYMVCSIHRPSGRLALASARKHRGFKLLSPEGGAAPVRWASDQAYEVAFSPDGAWVVANSVPTSGEPEGARRIEVRRADTGERVRELGAGIGATARWSADGRWLLTASLPDRVELWRTADWVRGAALAREIQSPNGTFALSPDGELLAAFNEVEVFLVSTSTGQVLTRLPEPPGTQGYVTDMAFSPDGRVLALLRRNAVLAMWDLERVRGELRARGLDW